MRLCALLDQNAALGYVGAQRTHESLPMMQSAPVAELSSGPPSLVYSLTELARGALEVASLGPLWPCLKASAPAGDGHTIMLLPGFMADDRSTFVLRSFLRSLGYRTLPWNQGRNNGSLEQQKRLARRFHRMVKRESAPITLIGQSLGGVYARELARLYPNHVRMVITLGSPFGATGSNGVNSRLQGLFRLMSGESSQRARQRRLHAEHAASPPVPCTAIYSKSDGVVPWQSCIERAGDLVENIELYGSHIGMAVHPHALHVIADRLVHDASNWRPFDRSTLIRKWVYPQAYVAPN